MAQEGRFFAEECLSGGCLRSVFCAVPLGLNVFVFLDEPAVGLGSFLDL